MDKVFISVICIACVDSVKCVHCALKCSPAGKLHHCYAIFVGHEKRTIPCPTKNVVNTEIERRRKGTPVAIQSGQALISVICIACVGQCQMCSLCFKVFARWKAAPLLRILWGTKTHNSVPHKNCCEDGDRTTA